MELFSGSQIGPSGKLLCLLNVLNIDSSSQTIFKFIWQCRWPNNLIDKIVDSRSFPGWHKQLVVGREVSYFFDRTSLKKHSKNDGLQRNLPHAIGEFALITMPKHDVLSLACFSMKENEFSVNQFSLGMRLAGHAFVCDLKTSWKVDH